MDENNQHTPRAGHEETDINEWAVGKFAVALLLVAIAALFLLFGLFRYFLSREGGPPSGRSQVAATEPAKAFPQPQLQETPVLDLKAIREAEDQVLNSYAWIDPEKGVVRIPINRAMDLLAERGLPSRPPSAVPSASNASVPTESGLGPKMLPPGGPLAGELK
ncbi:MAG: hypothetical protein ABSH44_03185 [Bryobacteraceae bacterium]|jgi:hypothetical protein